jgi:hypothetical protein
MCKRVNDLATQYSNYICTIISEHYPISEKLLNLFVDKCNWNRLSINKNLAWSVELLEKYIDKWNWWYLSSFHAWSAEIIETFTDKWNWHCLPENKGISCLWN